MEKNALIEEHGPVMGPLIFEATARAAAERKAKHDALRAELAGLHAQKEAKRVELAGHLPIADIWMNACYAKWLDACTKREGVRIWVNQEIDYFDNRANEIKQELNRLPAFVSARDWQSPDWHNPSPSDEPNGRDA